MDAVFPAIQQNVDFYADQFNIKFNHVGRWDACQKQVPISLLEMPILTKKGRQEIISGWAKITDISLLQKVNKHFCIRVSRSHPNRSLAGRIGTISTLQPQKTAEQQLEKLDKDCKELSRLWTLLFTDERWTAYLHEITAHSVELMKEHKQLGQFSNSVLEAFHKQVRWHYHHTNREGHGGQESSRAIMQQFYGSRILEIEAASCTFSLLILSSSEIKEDNCLIL